MEYKLEYIGNLDHDSIPFSEEVHLNRTTLKDDVFFLSREHTTIKTIDDHFQVIDHGSVAGTWVDGIKIGSDTSSIEPDVKRRYSSKNREKLKVLNKGHLDAKLGSTVELGAELLHGEYKYRIIVNKEEPITEDIPPEVYLTRDKKPVLSAIAKSIGKSVDSAVDDVINLLAKLPKPILYLMGAAVVYGACDLAVTVDSDKHIHEHIVQYYEQLKNMPSELIDNIFKNK